MPTNSVEMFLDDNDKAVRIKRKRNGFYAEVEAKCSLLETIFWFYFI